MSSAPSTPGKKVAIPRPPFHKVILIQLAVLLPAAAGMAIWNNKASIAMLLGGLTAALPQAWYAWYAFRDKAARSHQVTGRLVTGEMTKIVMVALLCAVIFRYVKGLDTPVFFVTLLAVMVLGWCITARIVNSKGFKV